MKICSISNCNNDFLSKGFCQKHYQRWRKHGDPNKVEKIRDHPEICTILGCEMKYISMGYCHKHYGRVKRQGNPLKVRIRIDCCKIKECNRKHVGLGYCKPHYRRFKEYGNPLIIRKHKREPICIINKCDKKHNAKGYCSTHYAQHFPEIQFKSKMNSLNKYGKLFDMSTYEYKYALIYWSKTIKKLDTDMCKNCSSKYNLHAHHIQPKSEYPKLSLDIDNGLTLCTKCHYKLHS